MSTHEQGDATRGRKGDDQRELDELDEEMRWQGKVEDVFREAQHSLATEDAPLDALRLVIEANLQPREREAVRLVVREGRTYKDAAHTMVVTEGALKRYVADARGKIARAVVAVRAPLIAPDRVFRPEDTQGDLLRELLRLAEQAGNPYAPTLAQMMRKHTRESRTDPT